MKRSGALKMSDNIGRGDRVVLGGVLTEITYS